MHQPLHLWVPVLDRLDLTEQFIADYQTQHGTHHELHIMDNGSATLPDWPNVHDLTGATIYEMWNWALDHTPATSNAAIANNDVRIHHPDTLDTLNRALNHNPQIGLISPGHGHPEHKGDTIIPVPPTIAQQGGPAGFFFAIPPRTWHQYRFPGYLWWYGDTDLFLTVHHIHGRALTVHPTIRVEHIGGGSQTAGHPNDRSQLIEHDRDLFDTRWAPKLT